MTRSGMTRIGIAAVACGVFSAACGGADGDDVFPSAVTGASEADAVPVDNGQASDGENDTAVEGNTELGAPTLQAEALQAWVEVDGERIEYTPTGSLSFECSIAPDRVIVNFQTGDGHDLSITGSPLDGQWNASTSFGDGAGAEFGYGGQLADGTGRLGIGDSSLSYEGPVGRVLLSDRTQTDETDVQIAVNCASTGDDPTVTVGGESFTVPFVGTQSISCEATPGDIDILINRLSSDGLQISISVRTEASGLIGSVALFTPAGTYSGSVPRDGAGLVVDGNTVSFDGTFTTPDGGEVAGTAAVTCP